MWVESAATTQSGRPCPASVSELTDFIVKGCCLTLDVCLLTSFKLHLKLT